MSGCLLLIPSNNLFLSFSNKLYSSFLFSELISAAFANPTIKGTGRVPDLNPFSCPPPSICISIFTLGFFLEAYKMPIPFGPYNL